jgi:adenylate cyclase
MGVQTTVVFTDLHGSTAFFEAMGNARATAAVTHITSWIGEQCQRHGGRVVKKLGDGVFIVFKQPADALRAVVEMQRLHFRQISLKPKDSLMPIRVGIASGEVEIVEGDCYGDAVNVASRLCDLCGPHQIWASADALTGLVEDPYVRFRPLGPIAVRGRAEPCTVEQIEWREEVASDFLTMQGESAPEYLTGEADALGRELELQWSGVVSCFKAFDLPIQIGRVRDAEFVVNDPRVSRLHARLEWRNGSVVLVDVSSYGTWVRFISQGGEVQLRRNECVLHGEGEIALGGSFSDSTVPTVRFVVR